MNRFFLFITFSFLFLLITISSKASDFEGNISFVCETIFDTTYITIMVKGDLIRVDEFNQKKQLQSSRLINLPKQNAIVISHDRKLYTNIIASPANGNKSNSVDLKKTGNYKEINGYKCYQWRVKDVQRNTEIAYWVAEERFDFFETLLKFLNRTEYSLKVFSNIPDSEGYFPLLTEERTLLRKEKLRIAVVEIIEANLNSKIFEIPEGYNAVRHL
jgi:hypothetical protein